MDKPVVVIYPVYGSDQNHQGLLATAGNISQQGHPVKLVVVTELADVRDDLNRRLGGVPAEYRMETPGGFAHLLNHAVESDPESIVVPLPEGVELLPSYFVAVAKLFDERPDAGAAFGSFKKPKGGTDEVVRVYPVEKPQHERHDLGFVLAYGAAAVRQVGGAREDLQFTAEFDLQLKIVEQGIYANLFEPHYRVHETSTAPGNEAEASSQRLHAPGKGRYGGFSYLFYPEPMDKELNAVFSDHLKRLNAFLDDEVHPTKKVPYPPAGTYEVTASVVIPMLNRVAYIGKAIESVVRGTFEDFEIVVVDNGSTDGSQDVVKEWSQTDKRVRLIEQKGKTISSALNRGIREARGKYICQLDSDDVYLPTTLEKMTGHFEKHPKCGLAISYYGLMDGEGNPLPELGLIKHLGYGRNVILRRDGAGALRVFPKVVLEEFGLYDEENFGNFGEDYDMVLKTGEWYDVDRVHEELYRYRRHEDNTDVTRDPTMKIQNKNNARLNAIARRQKMNADKGVNYAAEATVG